MNFMFRFLLLSLLAIPAFTQENWSKPYPGHKVAGNLYYVGTEDLACYLITTPEGHILVNTGLADSVPMIQTSMQSLGFKLEDIRILLTMQAHHDHVAGFAEIRKLAGAKVFATEPDAPVLEDGGKSDPFFKTRFSPVKVDRRLRDGEVVKLGDTEMVVHLTPGHTKGSVSYETTIAEGSKKYRVLLVNMGSVVMPLVDNSKYPQIIEDFANSFRKQKAMTPDIWLAGHASQYGMAEKHKAGSFVDPAGYLPAIERYEQLYLKQLKAERQRK